MAKKPLEKIHVGKSDETALVVERIMDAAAEEVVLSIPRFSRIAETAANFHLLRREAELLRKKIVIESVDDRVVDLAEKAGLEALNPLLIKSPRQFSDIVTTKKTNRHDVLKPAPEPEPEILEPEITKKRSSKRRSTGVSEKRKTPIRGLLAGLVFSALVIFIAVIVVKALPKVDLRLVIKKTPWDHEEVLVFGKDDGLAQTFNDTKVLTLDFPATGTSKVQKHAKGVITIYNAYSSEAQPLVQRTRFETPSGKIFRLTKGVTVPPAKVVNGKIVPSSIDAEVQADGPGPDYNLPPINRFTIPGLKGSPKFNGFYGESKAAMSGGAIGEVAVPTDGDIRKSKDEARTKIEEALSLALVSQMTGDFKVLEGATEFVVLKQVVDDDINSNGQFSVTTEARMAVVAFRDADVTQTLTERLKNELGTSFEFKSLEIAYGETKTDFKTGEVSVAVTGTGIVIQPVEVEDLKAKILGQTEADLRVLLSSIPGVDEGSTASFWPFWVKRVPTKSSRVQIDIF